VKLPNILSISRIPFLFLIVILLQLPPNSGGATFAFAVFVVAALTDFFDGWAARKFNQVSDLGKFLDALTDKILTLGLFITLLSMNILPAWTLLLVLFILTREFLVTGLRLIAAKRGLVLAAEKSGKLKMLFQVLSLGVLLFSQMLLYEFPDFLPDAQWNMLYQVGGVWLFCAASALTVFSGTVYMSRYGHLFLSTASEGHE